MRQLADAARIRRFMRQLGADTHLAARVYFTGGATAVLLGWRDSTIDVDLKFVPEHDALLRAIPPLKESLQINVELVSPADFIPVRAGWEERSPFIAMEGRLAFHHFDLYAQALAKIERGHAQDVEDVRAMLRSELITPARALQYFDDIEPHFYRYPALEPAAFRRAVKDLLAP